MEISSPSELSSNDLRIIFDEIDNPALLVDSTSDTIILANHNFIELSEYSIYDLFGCKTSQFIKSIQYEKIVDGYNQNSYLQRQGKQPLQIKFTVNILGKKNQFYLIKVTPVDSIEDEYLSFIKNIVETQLYLFHTLKPNNLKGLLSDLAELSMKIVGCEYSYIYFQMGDKERLLRYPEETSIFPVFIPAIELSRFQKPDFWEPGKRVMSELHRTCRIHQIHYLQTFPLQMDRENSGIFTTACKGIINISKIRERASIYADWITSILDWYRQFQKHSSFLNEVNVQLQKNQAILDLMYDGYIVLNEQREIIDFNDNFRRLIDYTALELLNNKIENIFNPASINPLMRAIDNGKNPDNKEEVQLLDRKGELISVDFQIAKFEQDSKPYLIVLFRDFSDKTVLLKKISEIETKVSLGEVVADFAHEVRNPINNLTTGLQLLSKKIDENNENQEIIGRLQDDCIRMNYLMESVLAYSRQRGDNLIQININDFINRLVSRFKSKFNQKEIEFRFRNETGPNEVNVMADQRALEQVFINIINNALDAISAVGSGAISIVLTIAPEKQDFVCIKIADTGFGIPEEIKNKVFEPFVSEKKGGTGLGLAIAKRIINAYQGWIDLETFPGGTIFSIYLPNAQEI